MTALALASSEARAAVAAGRDAAAGNTAVMKLASDLKERVHRAIPATAIYAAVLAEALKDGVPRVR